MENSFVKYKNMSLRIDGDISELVDFFPTRVYHTKFGEKKMHKINHELLNCISTIEWKEPKCTGKNYHSTTETFEDDVIGSCGLNLFKRNLDEHIFVYCLEMGLPKSKYKINSWFSKFEYGEYIDCKEKTSSDISGCYYLQSTGKDGNIFFINPISSQRSSFFENYQNHIEECPEVGKLLLYPGYLQHGTRENMTDNYRISLNFNIFFEN